jgi:hypothetical protein
MTIKKLAIAGVAAMSVAGVQLAQAAAGETCTGGVGQVCTVTSDNLPSDIAYTAGADSFVVSSFVFSVSSNVALTAEENEVAVAVGAASNKGRTPYSGSSNGGSVTVCGTVTVGSETPVVPTLSLENTGGCGAGDAAPEVPADGTGTL